MKHEIEYVKQSRLYFLSLIEGLTARQLNEIPAGFNNNIIWNLGHLLASQQSICYVRSGNSMVIDEKYLAAYKPETKPSPFVAETEIEEMKKLFLTAIQQFEKDYENGLFSNYTAFSTRYGINVNNIDEAISFLQFHEGLHVGYIMAMKHAVSDAIA